MVKIRKSIILGMTLSGVLALTACSVSAPRLTPGHLERSSSVVMQQAKVINIVQLSEKEVPFGKALLGGVAGAIVGSALSSGSDSDTVQTLSTDLGGDIGEDIVRENFGKTVYKLTLKQRDGKLKQVYVKGGMYQLGQNMAYTVSKKDGQITSIKAL